MGVITPGGHPHATQSREGADREGVKKGRMDGRRTDGAGEGRTEGQTAVGSKGATGC